METNKEVKQGGIGYHENEKIIILDPEAEYSNLEKILGNSKGEVLHLSPNNSNCYFDPLELVTHDITTESIVKTIQIIIECKKALNETIDISEILNDICLKNDLELSATVKDELLKAVQKC